MLQDNCYNIIQEEPEEYSIASGSMPSDLDSRPIWDAIEESKLNLQQALFHDRVDDIVESKRRIEWLWITYFK